MTNAIDAKNKQHYPGNFKDRKNELVVEYAPLVKKIAGRFGLRLPPDIDMDDLIQVGMIGLLESIDRYDPTKEANFKTYAEYRIRGSMLDELRSRDWIPRSVRANASKLDKAFLSLRKKGVETPTQEELAKELNLSNDEFEIFLNRNISISLISLDSVGKAHSDSTLDLLDIIVDPDQSDAEDKILSAEVSKKLAAAIDKLPEREKLVLSLSFIDELNLKEIAKVLEITEARVCQIRARLIGYLRSHLI